MMKGKMKEALEKTAHLEHIDPKTFAAFLEIAYTGGYSTTTFSVMHQDHSPFGYKDAFEDDTGLSFWRWVWHGKHALHCCICGTRVSLWSINICTKGCTPFCRNTLTNQHEYTAQYCVCCGSRIEGTLSCSRCAILLAYPKKPALDEIFACNACVPIYPYCTDDACSQQLQRDDESFPMDQTLNDILHHCKVYIFADIYGIKDLQSWALCWIWLNLFRVRDRMQYREASEFKQLAEILEYVTSNTKSTSGVTHGAVQADNLCRLITDFAVSELNVLYDIPECEKLLREDGSVKDELFMAALRARGGQEKSTLPSGDSDLHVRREKTSGQD